ncbi:hypothetical protein GGF31_007217 [Allomyces arbusculus]|nr:hypothetical protein GGF31_007217 [Allomyces arbusculus]
MFIALELYLLSPDEAKLVHLVPFLPRLRSLELQVLGHKTNGLRDLYASLPLALETLEITIKPGNKSTAPPFLIFLMLCDITLVLDAAKSPPRRLRSLKLSVNLTEELLESHLGLSPKPGGLAVEELNFEFFYIKRWGNGHGFPSWCDLLALLASSLTVPS